MVVGHNDIKGNFFNIIKSDKLSHAYIFCGKPGIGKKYFATELARALNCLQGSFFEACDCNSCKNFVKMNYKKTNDHIKEELQNLSSSKDLSEKNKKLAIKSIRNFDGISITHLDVRLIKDNMLNIKIARELSNFNSTTPTQGRAKVVIIDNAHKMNDYMANALLKTIEEASNVTYFILITDNKEVLLKTILSRCICINFKHLSLDEVRKILKDNVSDDKLDYIAHKPKR